jgi:hypothetical protein
VEEDVGAVVMCLPWWVRRNDDGDKEVRRDMRWERVAVVVDVGRVMGTAVRRSVSMMAG